jgi:hypothetical protein
MTPDEGYALTMSLIEEIKAAGCRVASYPARSRLDADCVAKYSGPDRVEAAKWIKVVFMPTSPHQIQMIREAAEKLAWNGITFDTGGGCGQRDWELDWSFSVKSQPDQDHADRANLVDDLIKGTMENPHDPD